VLVVQSNPFNDSRIATVVVAAITSNLALAAAPGNVRLGKSESGLRKASVVDVSRIVTLDRAMLTSRIRHVGASVMDRVNAGLRLVLNV
jgi:mRNA interferase MazF